MSDLNVSWQKILSDAITNPAIRTEDFPCSRPDIEGGMPEGRKAMTCNRCKQKIVMHANGDLACSCDYVDHRPLGEIPDWWDFDDDLFLEWSESENPSEDVTI